MDATKLDKTLQEFEQEVNQLKSMNEVIKEIEELKIALTEKNAVDESILAKADELLVKLEQGNIEIKKIQESNLEEIQNLQNATSIEIKQQIEKESEKLEQLQNTTSEGIINTLQAKAKELQELQNTASLELKNQIQELRLESINNHKELCQKANSAVNQMETETAKINETIDKKSQDRNNIGWNSWRHYNSKFDYDSGCVIFIICAEVKEF